MKSKIIILFFLILCISTSIYANSDIIYSSDEFINTQLFIGYSFTNKEIYIEQNIGSFNYLYNIGSLYFGLKAYTKFYSNFNYSELKFDSINAKYLELKFVPFMRYKNLFWENLELIINPLIINNYYGISYEDLNNINVGAGVNLAYNGLYFNSSLNFDYYYKSINPYSKLSIGLEYTKEPYFVSSFFKINLSNANQYCFRTNMGLNVMIFKLGLLYEFESLNNISNDINNHSIGINFIFG